MNPDEQYLTYKDFNQAVERILAHKTSSPPTIDAIQRLENKMSGFVSKEMFAEKMDRTMEKLIEIHEQTKKTNGNVKCNTEWRLKNVHLPKIVYSVVGIVLTTVFMAVLSKVF